MYLAKRIEKNVLTNIQYKNYIEQNQDPFVFPLSDVLSLVSIGLFESIVNRISFAHLTGEKIKDIPVWHPHKQNNTKSSNTSKPKQRE
jgi:hypothetical protein